MTKRVWYNNKLYTTSIIFSKHAYDRIKERCVAEERVIDLIKKGFAYVLENAEDNKDIRYCNSRYAKLISTLGNFKVLLVAKWVDGCLNISVVTILLDLYDNSSLKRIKKDTTEYYI